MTAGSPLRAGSSQKRLAPRVLLAAFACVAFCTATQANDRAWLGIWMGVQAGQMAGVERSHNQIVFILGTERGGPAETAGLAPFDVILEIDGQPVHNRQTIFCLIKAARPGQVLLLAIRRQSETHTVYVTLAKWPKDELGRPNFDCPPPRTSFKREGWTRKDAGSGALSGRQRVGRFYVCSARRVLSKPGGLPRTAAPTFRLQSGRVG